MSIYASSIGSLLGSTQPLSDAKGKVSLIVNVASRCGLTPQYAALQGLHDRFADRGFTVIGIPCNQFLGQEPGTAEEIHDFCSTTFNVSFPLSEKVDVNGDNAHPMYSVLREVADGEGYSGDIRWNFEKFVVDRDGAVVARFHPKIQPDAPEVVEAISTALGAK
jgi:glutathione peroxidase